MEDNTETVEVSDTEVTVEREAAPLSIRESLKQQLKEVEEENETQEPAQDTTEETDTAPVESEPVVEQQKPLLAPPADMNAAEKEAFLNPTAANAHILQSYLNRRAYETRSDYSRKMQEVEQLKKQTAGL